MLFISSAWEAEAGGVQEFQGHLGQHSKVSVYAGNLDSNVFSLKILYFKTYLIVQNTFMGCVQLYAA